MEVSPVVQWLRLCLPIQGVWVQFLIRELRSCMPHSQKKQTKNVKWKQYCNKINKDLKNCPYLKKKKLGQRVVIIS